MKQKLGIIGGGQLGRMLIQSCLDLDITPYVIDSDKNSPCAFIGEQHYKGSFRNPNSLKAFWNKFNFQYATIEIEDVSIEGLDYLEYWGVQVFPQIDLIYLIKDKGAQKEFYRNNHLPTSDFFLVDDLSNIQNLGIKFPFVQKTRFGGYDGKGVSVINGIQDWDKVLQGPSVIENKVNIQKEISVIVAQNPDTPDGLRCYPPVEMVFHPTAHLVQYLFAPADISPKMNQQCQEIAIAVAQKMGIRGLLAVELFIDTNDTILINEVAPRPHNSGHMTIEACYTSQFENHLRAVFGYPLGATDAISPSAMVNIIGSENASGAPKYDALKKIMSIPGARLHLYGKTEVTPFRKMGHVTVLANSINELKARALQIQKIIAEDFN